MRLPRFAPLRPLLALAALTLLALPARAGTFVIESITGGTSTYDAPPNHTAGSYSNYYDGAYGCEVQSTDCSGAIVATLRWYSDPRMGADPPPQQAVVMQGCIAKGEVSCVDGFQDPVVNGESGEQTPAGCDLPLRHFLVKPVDADGRVPENGSTCNTSCRTSLSFTTGPLCLTARMG